MKYFNWLKPGIYIKRWIFAGGIGIILVIAGVYPCFYRFIDWGNAFFHVVALFAGIALIIFSVRKAVKSLFLIFGISNFTELLQYKIYEKHYLDKGCRIVVIGGGTGLSVILRGFKKVTSNITAIVTTMDDGGGSGVLREDLGMLPPGDIRSCILALADTEEDMQELFQYRFKEGRLSGQSFGNLLIAALTGVYDNFEEAVTKVHEILAVKGRVLPVTAEDVKLCAELENGEKITGESQIPLSVMESKSRIRRVSLEPSNPKPIEETISAIKDADIIVFGPGSLYTSIIPNFLVKGIIEALSKSKAKKVFITNIMTQPGETDGYSVLDHLKAVDQHIGRKIIDCILVNNERISADNLIKYKDDGAKPVYLNKKESRKLKREGIKIIEGAFVDEKQGYIRHDADRIADVIKELASKQK